MREYLKLGLFFSAGIAAGALGAVALSKGKLNLRPALAGVVAGGMELKEKAACLVERAKESVEDIVAEADHSRKERAKGNAGSENGAA